MAISASAHESMLGGPRGPDDSERIPPATSGLIYDSGSMSETSASSMSETGASSISEDSDASSISMSEQARRRGERARWRGERGGEASRRGCEASERDAEGRSANEGQNGFGNRGSRREPRVAARINSKWIWKPMSQGQSRLLWPARGRTTCIVQLERTPRTTSKTYTEGVWLYSYIQ